MKLKIGSGLLALTALLALFAPFLTPYDVGAKNLSEQLSGPSVAHWLGQTHHGEDLLTVILYGGRVSLWVGLVTVLLSGAVGTLLGLISGYLGGAIDAWISRTADLVLAFPGILLAVAIAAVLGPSVGNVILALCVSGWVPFARLARAQALSLREREYVRAARSLGVSETGVMVRHILPNIMGSLVVQGTFSVAAAILAESSLSFLGLGVPPGTPSWGGSVAAGVRYLLRAPHLATFPGLAVMITVLALNVFGDGLKDRIEAR